MTDTVAAIVVAAGRGERAGGDVPKQYRDIAGEPMLRPTLRAFLNHPRIGVVQPVINASDESFIAQRRPAWKTCRRRFQAARRGKLRCAPGSRPWPSRAPDLVLIHDAARPFLSGALVERAIAAGKTAGAAVPG